MSGYVDKNRQADLMQARLFRDTLRADVDAQIAKLVRLGNPYTLIARVLSVDIARVRKIAATVLERDPRP